MPPDEHDGALLWDMLDSAQAVRSFVSGRTYEEYLENRMLRGAVERNVQIIGEAASKVSAAFRDSHPEVPWQRIIAQRHVLAHEYGEIDPALLWRVATIHLPVLIDQLRQWVLEPPDA